MRSYYLGNYRSPICTAATSCNPLQPQKKAFKGLQGRELRLEGYLYEYGQLYR